MCQWVETARMHGERGVGFFIKDKVAQKEIEVRYCPMEIMWSDVMTKSQQGRLFREMRAIIMNRPIDYDESIIRYVYTFITGVC